MFIKQVRIIAGFFPLFSALSLMISLHGLVYRPYEKHRNQALALIVVMCALRILALVCYIERPGKMICRLLPLGSHSHESYKLKISVQIHRVDGQRWSGLSHYSTVCIVQCICRDLLWYM